MYRNVYSYLSFQPLALLPCSAVGMEHAYATLRNAILSRIVEIAMMKDYHNVVSIYNMPPFIIRGVSQSDQK